MRLPSWAGSLAIHTLLILALLFVRPAPLPPAPARVTQIELVRAPLQLPPAPATGGGGGGGEQPRRASKGSLPRVAELVFTPPTTGVTELEPALSMAPALMEAPRLPLLGAIGDPLGVPGPPSDGPGRRGGIGGGADGGIGDGDGARAGIGNGPKGGYNYRELSTLPQLIYKVEPEFSEEARKARYNGSVLLRCVIDENGQPRDLVVLQSPGLGLAEKALQSVTQWRFRPGRKNGKAVPVEATVEVNFRLL